MKLPIDFDKTKNAILKETRGVNFEDVIEAISQGKLLGELEHPNKKKYPNQKIFIIMINEYVYAVPYVIDKRRKVLFLKTVYPNRILTKKYLKGENETEEK